MASSQVTATGIYVRISEDDEETGLGVARQEEDCRKLAASKGWPVIDVYADNDISASTKSKKRRPQYERMRADAEAGRIDGIVVYNMDRLTRRVLETAQFLSWLPEVGVQFATTEGDDTTTAAGRMIINIKASVAQHEAEKISERVLRSKKQRRDMGRVTSAGGYRAFGWSDPQMQHIDPKEAEAIRDGAAMILAGQSINDVLRDWTRRGVRPVKAEHWGRSVVGRALTAPRMAGFMVYEKQVIGKGDHQPILDEATWRAVVATIEGRREARATGVSSTTRRHLLSGITLCGSCGSRMVARYYNDPTRRADSRYACIRDRGGCGSNSRGYLWLHDRVSAFVEEALSRTPPPSAALDAPQSDVSPEVDRLEGVIDQTRQKMVSGLVEAEDGFAVIASSRQEINELKRSMVVPPRRVLPYSDSIDVWRDVSPDNRSRRRAIVESVIERIVVLPRNGREPCQPESVRIEPKR